MEIPQGNTLENSGKQNPKMGFKSPPRAEEKNPACNSFGDFLIDSRPKNHEYDPPISTHRPSTLRTVSNADQTQSANPDWAKERINEAWNVSAHCFGGIRPFSNPAVFS